MTLRLSALLAYSEPCIVLNQHPGLQRLSREVPC